MAINLNYQDHIRALAERTAAFIQAASMGRQARQSTGSTPRSAINAPSGSAATWSAMLLEPMYRVFVRSRRPPSNITSLNE
jgi:hypothetical protein